MKKKIYHTAYIEIITVNTYSVLDGVSVYKDVDDGYGEPEARSTNFLDGTNTEYRTRRIEWSRK